MATEIIIALMKNEELPQVILLADEELVEMSIKTFKLPWKISTSRGDFTIVYKK